MYGTIIAVFSLYTESGYNRNKNIRTMAIPKEILAVERPRNTVVQAYGKNKDRYLVKARTGCRYVNGKRYPVNGPTVGHIVGGKYVPVEDALPERVSARPDYETKHWAAYELCSREFEDILDELLAVYHPDDARKLACIAMLRTCSPGIKDYELRSEYESGFLSELLPGVGLSRNTVCEFHKAVGRNVTMVTTFMRNRAAKVGLDHHVLVDGTLKSDESSVNTFSDFSRKAKTKGTRDISLIYAFDLEEMEPVCAKCYSGNMPDVTAYEDFVRDCGIKNGLIVADKGFPSGAAGRAFRDNPGLHYLNPVKRNSGYVKSHDLYSYEGILQGTEDIQYKKAKVNGKDKWLYSFRDPKKAALEEQAWIANARKNNTYNDRELKARRESFGTIVLESDMDLPPKIAYIAYSHRWTIEILMRFYKATEEFDETRVHSDVSVIGSEFCNFLATVLTSRLVKRFDEAGLLDEYTYGRVMKLLMRAQMVREAGTREWTLSKQTKRSEDMLKKLGLIDDEEEEQQEIPQAPVKRKRGRPRKNKV